jgi:hypothetical protein
MESSVAVAPNVYKVPPIVFLFASFLDTQFKTQIRDKIRETSELIVGGAETVSNSCEIELLSDTIYYFTSLSTINTTFGQQFCDIHPFSVIQNDETFVAKESTPKQKALRAFYYVILPYLYVYRTSIWSACLELWDMMTFRENNEEENRGVNDNRSLLSTIFEALKRSFLLISNESGVRLERVIGFCRDIHLYYFTCFGR